MRKKLKAVLFDMDGVLFNSMPYHSEAWHQVMKTHGLDLSREEAYMHEGRTGASTINIVFQRELGKEATPNPEPYLMALRKGGFKADEAIVIENAPLGVEAGHKAGIFTIAVNTGPLDGQVLLDAGADLLFPSMQALCDSWDTIML